MKKFVREPLFHFLIIGALFFLLYSLYNPAPKKNEIVIDDNLINELVAKWTLQRNSQPSVAELIGLVDQYVEQELFYQEALVMNLDHNDEIVKRRLAQKMEFISDNMSASLQPTEEMLKAYYEKHKDNYPKPSVYSFKQIFFDEDSRKDARTDAQLALQAGSPESSGDAADLPLQYLHENAIKIGRDFGGQFEASLDSLPLNQWAGPIHSGYGYHLVYINEKKTSSYYSFAEVKEKVGVDYNFEAIQDFKKELISSLLKKYTIELDIKDAALKSTLDEKY